MGREQHKIAQPLASLGTNANPFSKAETGAVA
jgi:hypothetical protein